MNSHGIWVSCGFTARQYFRWWTGGSQLQIAGAATRSYSISLEEEYRDSLREIHPESFLYRSPTSSLLPLEGTFYAARCMGIRSPRRSIWEPAVGSLAENDRGGNPWKRVGKTEILRPPPIMICHSLCRYLAHPCCWEKLLPVTVLFPAFRIATEDRTEETCMECNPKQNKFAVKLFLHHC